MVVRISITLPDNVAERLDEHVKRIGVASRSKVIADAIRAYLAERVLPKGDVFAVVVYAYNPARGDTVKRLIITQHRYHDEVAASAHVHASERECVEVAFFEGSTDRLSRLIGELERIPGVATVRIVLLRSLQPKK